MRSHVLSALLIVAASFTCTQSSPGQSVPTAADAKAFVDRANTELLKLATDASHA